MTIVVFLVTIFVTMALGVPVAFALMFCGIVLMEWMGIFNASILSQQMIQGANTFTLLAIPFFLLAGELMNAGGLSRRIDKSPQSSLKLFKADLSGIGLICKFDLLVLALLTKK